MCIPPFGPRKVKQSPNQRIINNDSKRSDKMCNASAEIERKLGLSMHSNVFQEAIIISIFCSSVKTKEVRMITILLKLSWGYWRVQLSVVKLYIKLRFASVSSASFGNRFEYKDVQFLTLSYVLLPETHACFFIVDCENTLQHNFLQICSNWLTSRNNKAKQKYTSKCRKLRLWESRISKFPGGGHALWPPRKEGP